MESLPISHKEIILIKIALEDRIQTVKGDEEDGFLSLHPSKQYESLLEKSEAFDIEGGGKDAFNFILQPLQNI